MGIEQDDEDSEAIAKAPRVSLARMKDKIAQAYYINPFDAVGGKHYKVAEDLIEPAFAGLKIMTICLLVMKSGFIVVGKSAPASPENFNQSLGNRFAYEDAIRQLWQLEGYLLRNELTEGEKK